MKPKLPVNITDSLVPVVPYMVPCVTAYTVLYRVVPCGTDGDCTCGTMVNRVVPCGTVWYRVVPCVNVWYGCMVPVEPWVTVWYRVVWMVLLVVPMGYRVVPRTSTEDIPFSVIK